MAVEYFNKLLWYCDRHYTVRLLITWGQTAFIKMPYPENNQLPYHSTIGSEVSYCPDKNDLFGEMTPSRNRLTGESVIIQYEVNSNTI